MTIFDENTAKDLLDVLGYEIGLKKKFVYDPSRHETMISNNYDLKMLDEGHMEVPIVLKTRHGYLQTGNPEYRDNTDNQYLQLNFIFDNGKDAEAMYKLLKKGTLQRVQRHTGRFKPEESLKKRSVPCFHSDGRSELTDYPQGRVLFD